ncbi:Rho GTPase activation protein [Chlamydoabsidia padenii]|nr:Rho GTPase activation protein [Chlamydoabsidia padenii]
MIKHSTLPNKTRKNPIYYLWAKWSQPSHREKGSSNYQPLENKIQYNQASILTTVQQCCNEIMKRGLETEGLFRLSGATCQVLQLQHAFNKQPTIDLTHYDIHAITSFLKKYLYQLPTPIIPPAYHDAFLHHQVVHAVGCFPALHYQLFVLILTLIEGVQRHVGLNRMDPEALAVILAPICAGLDGPSTHGLNEWIKTNARWTRSWEWIIEHHHTILSSLEERQQQPIQPTDVSSWYGDHQIAYTITPPHASNSSFLSSGFPCRKSPQGFLRRLTSLSSLR